MGGIICLFILALAVAIAAVGWCGGRETGSRARWAPVIAVVALALALLGAWMLPHRAHASLRPHHDSLLPLSMVILTVALLARRIRTGPWPVVSGRKLAAIFALILALHVTVIAGLVLLHHFHTL
jgi:hypothetical protein